MNQLPTFKGWTVDVRLKQFRKADPAKGMVFLDFDTIEGDELLSQFVAKLDINKEDDKEILLNLCR